MKMDHHPAASIPPDHAMTRKPVVRNPGRRAFLAGTATLPTLWLAGCGGTQSDLPTAPPVGNPTPPPAMPLNGPRGLHVSLTGDAASSRAVTWFTDGTEAGPSLLEFDTVTPAMSASDIQTMPMAVQAEGSADATPGVEAYTHRASVEVLDPSLPFRYRVGDGESWSDVRVVQPTPSGNWRFTLFGDHGITERAALVNRQVLNTPTDLLLIAGDLSYANGNQPVWDQWFGSVEPLLSERVTMTAPGNHEEEDDGGNTFKNRFTHPGRNTFYSFDYNRVHFMVSTAGALINDGTLPEELLTIETDLALAAARRAAGEIDFICVLQHFTIWTDQEGRAPANPSLVLLEENILVRYGVDVVLCGHDHVYQRSVPMAFGIPNPLGYVQMMVGTGGQSVRLFEPTIQSWSAKEFIGTGYAIFDVEGRTMRGQYIGTAPTGLGDDVRQNPTDDFQVVDSFEIQAKDMIACRACALPPRNAEALLANYDATAAHTRQRNAHALAHCA